MEIPVKLSTLVYVSTATAELDRDALHGLVSAARARNADLGVTGYLVYDGTGFAQLLEGPAESIDALWKSISRDPRHRDLSVVVHEDSTLRCFGGWSMGASNLDAASAAAARAMRGVLADFFDDRAPGLAEVQAFFLTFAEFEVDAQAVGRDPDPLRP